MEMCTREGVIGWRNEQNSGLGKVIRGQESRVMIGTSRRSSNITKTSNLAKIAKPTEEGPEYHSTDGIYYYVRPCAIYGD